MFSKDSLAKRLILHEGIRQFPYKDTVGKLTIGVGRNLTDRGLSRAEIEYLLSNDIDLSAEQLSNRFPWATHLDPVRHGVLVEMCFNLGIVGLAKFRHTLHAVEHGRYQQASEHMLDSLWATQVGPRAQRLARMMRTGADDV